MTLHGNGDWNTLVVQKIELRRTSIHISTWQSCQSTSHPSCRKRRSDVHRCNSQVCPACSPNHKEPEFMPSPPVNPLTMRILPKRWWDVPDGSIGSTGEPSADVGLIWNSDILWRFFKEILDDSCQCDDVASTLSNDAITWIRGNLRDSNSIETTRETQQQQQEPQKRHSYSTDADEYRDCPECCFRRVRAPTFEDDDSTSYDEPCL